MQTGYFDLDARLALLEKLGDPLPKLERLIDWEAFRSTLDIVYRCKPRKSAAGRKPYDVVLMFKVLVLQHLYNLADEQTEYQIRDRYSFCRFLGLTPEGRVPDARTIWLFRERLKEHELIESLFAELLIQIEAAGFRARKGQILDASIVPAPRQRNTRKENAAIKAGELPEGWEKKSAAFLRQKDRDARWTRKHHQNHYGYKNHVVIDVAHKLVRDFAVTDAALHDGKKFEELLDPDNTSRDVWADSAYRSKAREEELGGLGYRSHINTRAQAGHPLSERQVRANHRRSKIRCRIEHVFGDQESMGGKLVRTIGIGRATVKIGLTNFAYNLRRFGFLQRARARAA